MLGKVSIGKNSKDIKHIHGEHKNVKLTDKELQTLKDELKESCNEYIDRLSNYLAIKNVSYKSHYLTIRNWYRKDAQKTQENKTVVHEKGVVNL